MAKNVDIEGVVLRIRARIDAGHYQHGFIAEVRLARTLGVKLGHVRQAMHKLNLAGVVSQRTRPGGVLSRGTRYYLVRRQP